jgi:hypothetical protein
MLIVQLAFGATVVQLLVSLKFLPIVTLDTMRFALPVFVRVTGLGALFVPTV